MALFSASSWSRVRACAASVVLPQVRGESEAGVRGHAIHAFVEAVAQGADRAEALAKVPEQWRSTCEQLEVREGVPEIAFAVRVADGAVRELGRSIERDYKLGIGEIAGTADLVRTDGEHVHVLDYKTGRAVEAAGRNAQLRFLAYAAAKVFAATRATVTLVYVHEDGSTHEDSAELDAFDLAEIPGELRQSWERIGQAKDDVKRGRQPALFEGEHCRYCPARTACPAKVAMLRELATPSDLAARFAAELTPETARLAYERVQRASGVVADLRAALYAYGRENPIVLGDGRVFGPVETAREELDARVVFEVLREEHGPDVAMAAVELTATKAGLERALKPLAARGQLAALKRTVLGKVEAAGGVRVEVKQTVREHLATETTR